TEYSASEVNSSKNRSSLGSSRMAIGTFSVGAAQPVRRLRQPVNLAKEPLAELVHLTLGRLVGDQRDEGVVATFGLDGDCHSPRSPAPRAAPGPFVHRGEAGPEIFGGPRHHLVRRHTGAMEILHVHLSFGSSTPAPGG